MGAGESPLVCKKKQRRKHRLGAVAPRLVVLRTGWAHTSQKFAWATCVLRQFRTLSAKQKISSLLFMLKSNKNPGPLLNGSRTPTGGPRGTMFPLDIPSPQAPSGSIKCLSGKKRTALSCSQTVDKALLLQGFAIVGTAFLI